MKTIFSVLAWLIVWSSLAAAQDGWRLSESHAAERDKLWRADLKQLTDDLPKLHKNLFFKSKEADFKKAAAALDANIPKWTDEQVLVEFSKLVASAGDAHTALQINTARPEIRYYPFQFAQFTDGMFVIAAAANKEVIGSKISKIDGTPVDKVMEMVATVFPHENDATISSWGPSYMGMVEVLSGLGIVKDVTKAKFTFTGPDGKNIEIEAAPATPETLKQFASWLDIKKSPRPFRSKKQGAYWTDLIPGTKILYIQYNQCADFGDMPMAKFAAKIGEFFDQLAIEKVVVDLRFNGGGNSEVARPLIDIIKNNKKLNAKGNLFVLIGRRTFSSAMINAHQFRAETAATLVGEPTSQKPNSYGEVRSFILKNSGLKIFYSTKLFKFIETDDPSLMPDVTIEFSSADFADGKDPVLDAVVEGKVPVK